MQKSLGLGLAVREHWFRLAAQMSPYKVPALFWASSSPSIKQGRSLLDLHSSEYFCFDK